MTVEVDDDIEWENDGDWFGEAHDFAVRIKAERAELREQLAAALGRAEAVIAERDKTAEILEETISSLMKWKQRAESAEARIVALEDDIETEQRRSIEWCNVVRKIGRLVGVQFYTIGQSMDVVKAVSVLKRRAAEAETHVEVMSRPLDEDETAVGFLRSWLEAQEGNAQPISQLWDGIDSDEESE